MFTRYSAEFVHTHHRQTGAKHISENEVSIHTKRKDEFQSKNHVEKYIF